MCLAMLSMVVGCLTPIRLPAFADRYHLEVALEPSTHRLAGRAVVDVSCPSASSLEPDAPVMLEFLLHPSLRVRQVETGGVGGRYVPSLTIPVSTPGAGDTNRHHVLLDRPVESLSLFVTYEGVLEQDVSAGEKAGAIHNLEMRTHIGPEGVFLGDTRWYPALVADPAASGHPAEFVLVARTDSDFVLQASADRDLLMGKQTGGQAWRTSFPIDGMALVGGGHEVHELEHRGVLIRAQLKSEQAKHAEGLLDTVGRLLDLYEPLIGPYPAQEFTVVDNFFSSGFAFSTFILLSSAVIEMGERSQTVHGYIDHELLHSWWGNGIFVDPRDGNWCEALATYGANYYGHVLDGNEAEARRKRRNYCHFLTRLSPEDDKPLGTYGLEGGCGRGIAYNKGAMVFHMLARRIGQENFWSALRALTDEYVGRFASWNNLQDCFERESGRSLESFFQQWVRRGGAPTIQIERATYDSSAETITLHLSQTEPTFELDVPVRVTHVDGVLDLSIPLFALSTKVTIPIDVVPRSVEVDPEYHIFRRVPEDDIIPSTSNTLRGDSLAIVLPDGVVAEGYQRITEVFGAGEQNRDVTVYSVSGLMEGALAQRNTLILGDAARGAYVGAFLGAVECPVRFDASGFEFEGVRYDEPQHAVLCTIVHPGVAGGGITVVVANSDAAIPSAVNIPMYDRSLVIFKAGRPIVRSDFERRRVIRVER